MANSDKNLVITPNINSATGEPTITFSGADPSLGPQSLQARIYPTGNGTLSFEGSAGQLFSITNSLTGTLFSVNDVSGLPSIEVLDTGSIRLARYSGNVLIGNVVDDGVNKLQFAGNTAFGNIGANNITFTGSILGSGAGLSSLNASNVTSGTLSNARTTAASANGASTIVARDANGDFASRIVTATLNGNISSATPTISATDGNFIVRQTVPTWTNSTSHPIVQWLFNTTYDDNLALSSGGNTTPVNQTSLIVSETGGIIFGKSNTAPTTNTVLSTEWGRANSAGIFLAVGAFTGSGSGLTSLNASNLSSGTVPGARGVTVGSGTASFVTYNGTTSTSGQFDGGTTNPAGTQRLNYAGNFYAANLNIISTADTSTAASHYLVETGSDGFLRPKTLVNTQAEIVTAATVNAVAQVAGSATSSVVRYSGTTAVAGQFDGGTTTPTASTRLNYGGVLHATGFSGNAALLDVMNSANVNTYNYPQVYPSFSLDFVNSKVIDPRITFSRSSIATYFDSNRTLRVATNNVPRIDYDPSTGAIRGLLIEEARTNSVTHSQSLRTDTLTVSINSGTFIDGETVTSTNGSTGVYVLSESNTTSFGIFNGVGAGFTGFLIGSSSGANATISTSTSEWSLTRANTISNVIAAPDGTITADKLFEDTSVATTHYLSTKSISVVTTSSYAMSVFLKAAERTWVLVNTGGTPFGTHGVYANLASGTLGTVVGTLDSTPTIQNVGNGWYRVSIVKTPSTNGSGLLQVRLANADNDTTYTGNGSNGVYVWGAQLETGAFATSYIPTTNAAVPRAADVASVNTLSPWYNATEGTLFAQVSLLTVSNDANRWVAAISDGTTGNYIGVFRQTDQQPVGQVQTSAGAQAGLGAGAVWTTTATRKLALSYATNDFKFCTNGGTVFIDTTGTVPTVTQLQLGVVGSTGRVNGWLERVTFYSRGLSNAELQSITTL